MERDCLCRPRVEAATADQIFVDTFFDDGATVEHHNPVGTPNGRQPVGDDQHRARPRQVLEGGHDELLGFGVERTGRFVEDQDGGVAQDRPGDRDSLTLSTRQVDAALGDMRVEAVGQAVRELVDKGELGGALHRTP